MTAFSVVPSRSGVVRTFQQRTLLEVTRVRATQNRSSCSEAVRESDDLQKWCAVECNLDPCFASAKLDCVLCNRCSPTASWRSACRGTSSLAAGALAASRPSQRTDVPCSACAWGLDLSVPHTGVGHINERVLLYSQRQDRRPRLPGVTHTPHVSYGQLAAARAFSALCAGCERSLVSAISLYGRQFHVITQLLQCILMLNYDMILYQIIYDIILKSCMT